VPEGIGWLPPRPVYRDRQYAIRASCLA